MDPLKITFTFCPLGGVREPKALVHLDDLLAWARVDIARKEGQEDFISFKDQLPLDKFQSDEGWCWKASALIFKTYLRYKELKTLTYKTDVIAADKASGLLDMRGDGINLGSGPWKVAAQFEPKIKAFTAEAYCYGDKAEVEELLSRITHVGKGRSTGHGKLTGIEVEVVPAAQAEPYLLYRTSMFKLTDDHALAICGVQSPYWREQVGYHPLKSRSRFAALLEADPYTIR